MLHCNKLQLATRWAIAAAALTRGSAVPGKGSGWGFTMGRPCQEQVGVGWQINEGQEPSASPINTVPMALVE